jgi:alpha-tubulin suppressor-like RCC1 family protein
LILLFIAALPVLPAATQAAPPPEETALISPWFPETVSAGDSYSCATRNNGTLACWGSDYADLTTPPAGTFTQVSAGHTHSCALRTDGLWTCWGSNDSGELNGYRIVLPVVMRGD